MGYFRSGAGHSGWSLCYAKQGPWAPGANNRPSQKCACAPATGIHPEMHTWLIFMRASTRGVCQGIWKPQPLFSASSHQSESIYSQFADVLTFPRWFASCLMAHSWSEVISQWAKIGFSCCHGPSCIIFSLNKCCTQGNIKKWQPQMSAVSVSYAWLWMPPVFVSYASPWISAGSVSYA